MNPTEVFQDSSYASITLTIAHLMQHGHHERAAELAMDQLHYAGTFLPAPAYGPNAELYDLREKADRFRREAAALGPADPTEEG